MPRPGNPRFLAQGGDWGSVIGAELARRHPDRCFGLHLNLAAIPPPPEADPVRTAVLPQEAEWLQANSRFWRNGMGYYALHTTRPQSRAVALADSPRGLLAWSDRDAAGRSHQRRGYPRPGGGLLDNRQHRQLDAP